MEEFFQVLRLFSSYVRIFRRYRNKGLYMKTIFLKRILFFATFISFIAMPSEANAWSLFGSEKDDALEEADNTYESAIVACEEGRANDAMALFSNAHSQYSSIKNTYPGFELEHINDRLGLCKHQMKIIKDGIVSGEISVPSPDEVLAGAGSTGNNAPINIGMPNSEGTVVKKTSSQQDNEDDSTEDSYSIAFSPNNPLAGANNEKRIQLITSMLKNGYTTDAILYIDELVEIEGDKTDISIRCLYVKALISVGNRALAKSELNKLKELEPNNPSVRSLVAALAIAEGKPMEAMLQLDKIIEEYPNYAEARVNYAYLLLMMDPATYRDAAIMSYTLALKLGAKRDINLETNLNIVIK